MIDMSNLQETQKNEQKHDLTFEEICPEWSRRIANYNELSETKQHAIRRDLMDSRLCFVGEANGHVSGWMTREGACDHCIEFGGYVGMNALCREFHPDKKLDWKEFNRKKDAFVKHWNEAHRN